MRHQAMHFCIGIASGVQRIQSPVTGPVIMRKKVVQFGIHYEWVRK
jgi:hypothetical protein